MASSKNSMSRKSSMHDSRHEKFPRQPRVHSRDFIKKWNVLAVLSLKQEGSFVSPLFSVSPVYLTDVNVESRISAISHSITQFLSTTAALYPFMEPIPKIRATTIRDWPSIPPLWIGSNWNNRCYPKWELSDQDTIYYIKYDDSRLAAA